MIIIAATTLARLTHLRLLRFIALDIQWHPGRVVLHAVVLFWLGRLLLRGDEDHIDIIFMRIELDISEVCFLQLRWSHRLHANLKTLSMLRREQK